MDLETKIREAILDELRRQLEDGRGRVEQDREDSAMVRLEGRVDLDAVAAVVAGTLAGGP